MNRWKQVANLFGLELNEEFKINVDGYIKDETYFFHEYFGLVHFTEDGALSEEDSGQLVYLFKGISTIIKKPWKPPLGKKCWIYSSLNNRAIELMWLGDQYDLTLRKTGNCFRTKEEAETKGKEIVKQLRKEYEEA